MSCQGVPEMDDTTRALNDVLDQLAYIRAQLDELLHRTPDRCAYCGERRSVHRQGFDIDHEFVA